MLDTSARLLRLLAHLQARRFWTGTELAQRLEVTERTVRRDVDRLRSLGYPVDSTAGVAGGYQLGAGAVMAPLLLEDDEALAVTLGLGAAAGSSVAGVGEASLRALVKLEQVLPARLRRRVNALRASITPLETEGPTVDATLLATLAGACRDHERLEFQYEATGAKTTARQVEPQGLVAARGRWYLVAWDVNRNDWRTFRVDRIAGRVTVGTRYMPRSGPPGGIRTYVSRSLSVEPYSQKVSVLLEAPIEVVAQRVPAAAGVLERVSERRCVLRTGGNFIESIAVWILHIGVDFRVLEPPELSAQLRLLHSRLERALEKSAAHRSPTKSRGAKDG